MRRGVRYLTALGAVAAAALAMGGRPVAAQASTGAARSLSLDEALRIAAAQSEQVTMAEAAVLRARGQQLQARSQYLPQLGLSSGYTRTLASEFQAAAQPDSAAPTPTRCDPFTADPDLPLAERVAQLEQSLACVSDADPLAALSGLFRNLPFGRKNQYSLGLSFSQNLFSGGRVTAQNRIADVGRRTAEVALSQARASLTLEVTQAYYDAVLSDRLLAIAEATLQQSESTLQQVQLARQVGSQPEFELLRAQVSRDNARPTVIQRQADRDLAYLRLKQLLNVPAGETLQLTSDLGDSEASPAARTAARLVSEAPPTPDEAVRTAVEQARGAVQVQEHLLDAAEAQRLPSLVLSSQYGRVAYPEGGLPSWSESRANWTVGVSLQVPLFTGGRVRGDQLVARANLMEARARLQQVEELAALDTRSAYQQLASALAAWQASQGTVEQASRAYQIADVRYREGISTQVELSDSRILLQQAQANRALASRNLQIAQARVALLPHLPLGAVGAGGAPAGGAQPPQGGDSQPAPQQAPRQQASSASFTGTPGVGVR